MKKILVVLAVAGALLVAGEASAVAATGHTVPQLRDTNWPCAGC